MCLLSGMAFGATSSSIGQGFKAGSDGIVEGAIVSLRKQTSDTIELSNLTNRTRLMGVRVNSEQTLLELDNGNPVQVVTTGAVAAFVSDLNGVIKAGDRVTASPINGVGMRATESVMVLGIAQADMALDEAESRTITTKSGQKRTVRVGKVMVMVDPMFYQFTAQSSFVPSAFQNLANGIAGHAVSPLRVMVAGLVIVLLLGSVIALVYSSIHSSIISIGRNPLSKRSVHKGLFEVGVTTFGILAFAIILVYLVLTT